MRLRFLSLLALLLPAGCVDQPSASAPDPWLDAPVVAVHVDSTRPVSEVRDELLSFAVDTSQVAGGHLWDPSGAVEVGSGGPGHGAVRLRLRQAAPPRRRAGARPAPGSVPSHTTAAPSAVGTSRTAPCPSSGSPSPPATSSTAPVTNAAAPTPYSTHATNASPCAASCSAWTSCFVVVSRPASSSRRSRACWLSTANTPPPARAAVPTPRAAHAGQAGTSPTSAAASGLVSAVPSPPADTVTAALGAGAGSGFATGSGVGFGSGSGGASASAGLASAAASAASPASSRLSSPTASGTFFVYSW